MLNTACLQRKPWELAFTAEPEEVAALRRIMKLHLGIWGLHEVVDGAQLCVSELVANVITHVGRGTPATLAVSMNDTYLRIEVHDPDCRALPTLMQAGSDCEGGRGMALVAATADRWGVDLRLDRKATWCELATEPTDRTQPHGSRALTGPVSGASRPLGTALVENAAVEVIAGVLHWLRAQGHDADELLDRAQTRFEAEIGT
ncbi:ATP-binding protein [Streptomyces sp. NPDC086077]|uniref:ATP-binding protein n=1 Tax=Streptomyces sp. NPDC086077 TaxID=3154862 RepID=UPI003443D5B5